MCLQQPARMMTICDAVLHTQFSALSFTAILLSEICPPLLLPHSLCGRQQGQIQALSAWTDKTMGLKPPAWCRARDFSGSSKGGGQKLNTLLYSQCCFNFARVRSEYVEQSVDLPHLQTPMGVYIPLIHRDLPLTSIQQVFVVDKHRQ